MGRQGLIPDGQTITLAAAFTSHPLEESVCGHEAPAVSERVAERGLLQCPVSVRASTYSKGFEKASVSQCGTKPQRNSTRSRVPLVRRTTGTNLEGATLYLGPGASRAPRRSWPRPNRSAISAAVAVMVMRKARCASWLVVVGEVKRVYHIFGANQRSVAFAPPGGHAAVCTLGWSAVRHIGAFVTR